MQRQRHTKTSRFKCEHCPSTFKRKEHMVRHKRTHTLEKPYDCAFCESAFTRKDLLVRHERNCTAANSYRNLCEFLESGEMQFLGARFPRLGGDAEKTNTKLDSDDQLNTLTRAKYNNSMAFDFLLPPTSSPLDPHSSVHSPVATLRSDITEVDNVRGGSSIGDPLLVPAIEIICNLTATEMHEMPSYTQFKHYVYAYKQGFAARIPIIHHSTLNLKKLHDVPASAVLIAIAALGALYYGTHEHAHRLQSLARSCVAMLFDSHNQEREHLNVLQASLICSIFDAWSEEVHLVEAMLDDQPRFERVCLRALSRRRERVTTDWKSWIIRESYHRLFWGWFTLMSNLNVLHGGIIRLPMARAYDITLPDAETAWRAKDSDSWRSLLLKSEPPVTLNGGLSGGLESFYHQELSAYSRFVIQRALLHQSSTIDQVWGIGGVQNIPGSIGMDYLRSICDEQVDTILSNLSDSSSHLSMASEVAELETLTQLIRLRRLHLLSPHRRQRLSAFLLDGDMDGYATNFLSRRLSRSNKITTMMTTCLQYIETHAIHQERFESIEELMCAWECILSLVLWVRTIEVEYTEGVGIDSSESAAITELSDAVSADALKGANGTYLTTRLVLGLSTLLRMEKRWGVAKPMAAFLDLILPHL
ncbi:hypothetical protein V1512DRAFT_265776 [Lipomyces arxii]|uniref:uncharacterized protein n=1 Tax=Lipomyces arxii TaxID=56418 RepID=UPI0034CE65F5